MGVDEALQSLGRWGRWQTIHYFLICVVFALPATWQLFAIVFIGFPNDHHCLPAPNSTLQQSVPLEMDSAGQSRWSRCSMYAESPPGDLGSHDNTTVECARGWWYDSAGFAPGYGTITMEWDLVCSRSAYTEHAQTIFVLGVCLGALLFSPMADRWGRRRTMFACQVALDVLGAAMAFSPNYVTLCVLQFCTGALAQGLYMAGMVLTCEMWPSSVRTVLAPGIYIITSTFTALLAPLAAWARQWRHLQLAISVSPIVTLLYYKFCPESLLWLVSKGRHTEAKELLRVAARCNGVRVPTIDLETRHHVARSRTSIKEFGNSSLTKVEDSNMQIKNGNGSYTSEENVEENEKRETLIQLFKQPKPRRYALIMFYLVFVNNLMYFGLTLVPSALPGDLFLNFTLMALLDIPGTVLAMALSHCWGRRKPLCIFHIISGISFLIGSIIVSFPGHNLAVTVIFLTAKVGVSSAWAVELVYAQEIFPTSMRSTSLGVTSGIGLVGSIFAPYAVYLVRTMAYIPCIIFAVLSLVGAILVLFEVETHSRALPSTIEEVCLLHEARQGPPDRQLDRDMEQSCNVKKTTSSPDISVTAKYNLNSCPVNAYQNFAYEPTDVSSSTGSQRQFEIVLNPNTLLGIYHETSV